MNPPVEKTPSTPAPRSGLQLMALVLVVFAALAVYSNVQKARRDQVETVKILPATPSQSPSPAASNP